MSKGIAKKILGKIQTAKALKYNINDMYYVIGALVTKHENDQKFVRAKHYWAKKLYNAPTKLLFGFGKYDEYIRNRFDFEGTDTKVVSIVETACKEKIENYGMIKSGEIFRCVISDFLESKKEVMAVGGRLVTLDNSPVPMDLEKAITSVDNLSDAIRIIPAEDVPCVLTVDSKNEKRNAYKENGRVFVEQVLVLVKALEEQAYDMAYGGEKPAVVEATSEDVERDLKEQIDSLSAPAMVANGEYSPDEPIIVKLLPPPKDTPQVSG